jgi:hypothetical protein
VRHYVAPSGRLPTDLGFFANSIEHPWLCAYFFFYFIWPIAYIGITLWKKQISSFSLLCNNLRDKQIIDIEFIVFVAAAGMIPGIVLPLGDNAIYFQEFQYFLGAAYVLAGIRHALLNPTDISLSFK